MKTIRLMAPFTGWAGSLEELTDAVFAGRLLGDGVALDPFEGVVRSPCDAVVLTVAATGHSITLRTQLGAELLIHFGIDTVTLAGAGFLGRVRAGDAVKQGDILFTVELDRVALHATSLATPIICLSENFNVRRLAPTGRVAAGEPLFELVAKAPSAEQQRSGGDSAQVEVVMALKQGLHARPAARIVAALKPLAAQVTIAAKSRSANARSVAALLALDVRHGDAMTVTGLGVDAGAAVAAVAGLVTHGADGEAPMPAPARSVDAAATPVQSDQIRAVRAAPGQAIGFALQYRAAEPVIPEQGAGIDAETARLDAAVTRLAAELRARNGASDIAMAHVALLEDPELIAAARAGIGRGKSAAFAWSAASRDFADGIRATGNPHLVERIADLRDVALQLALALEGAAGAAPALPAETILIAEELLPSTFLSLDHSRLAGIITTAGGPTSHVAILAASAGVPMVVSAHPHALAIADGTPLILNANTGLVQIAPDEARREAARRELKAHAEQARRDGAAAHAPCATADGRRIEVFANCANAADAAAAVSAGAEGCGLLRTELLFLERADRPGEDEQVRSYAAIAAAFEGRPLIVRTLDIGADKPVACGSAS